MTTIHDSYCNEGSFHFSTSFYFVNKYDIFKSQTCCKVIKPCINLPPQIKTVSITSTSITCQILADLLNYQESLSELLDMKKLQAHSIIFNHIQSYSTYSHIYAFIQLEIDTNWIADIYSQWFIRLSIKNHVNWCVWWHYPYLKKKRQISIKNKLQNILHISDRESCW
jgi:hypothetical protein